MKHRSFLSTILVVIIAGGTLASCASLCGKVSIVYSLKIAETTKREAVEEGGNYPSTFALTPFNQYRHKYSGSRHNYGGNMFSYIYSPKGHFARVDFAWAQVNADHGTYVTTQTDDLLFTGGYSFSTKERAKFTIAGLFGVPTHTDKSITHPQFGYAHIGLGGQFDGAIIFNPMRHEHTFRFAVRGIHFFDRKVKINESSYHYTYGTMVDIYISIHLSEDGNRFEFGYNPTFLVGSSIKPFLPDIVKATEYKRNAFFAVYKRRYKIGKLPLTFGGALSYGFDFEPLEFGNKRIITAWVVLSAAF